MGAATSDHPVYEMTLKAAMVCSTLFHVGFLALRPPSALVPLRQTLYPLEVSYVIVPEERASPAALTQPKRPVSKPASENRAAEPRKSEPPAPAQRKQQEAPKRQDLAKPPDVPRHAPAPTAPRGEPGRTAGILPQTHSGAAALPEGEFAWIRHKELVREHLRRELRYPETMLRGTVRLRVTLLPDGRLKEAAVLEASDPRLSSFALQDARAAGPYPGFPKEMKAKDAEYEFLVQYLPDRVSS